MSNWSLRLGHWSFIFPVGREAIESSSPGLQPGAKPSQLPTPIDCRLWIAEQNEKGPPFMTAGLWMLKGQTKKDHVTSAGERIAAARIARRQRKSVCNGSGGAWWFLRSEGIEKNQVSTCPASNRHEVAQIGSRIGNYSADAPPSRIIPAKLRNR